MRPGLPVPSRRTLPAGILPYGRSKRNLAPQSLLRSVSYAARLARATPPVRGYPGGTCLRLSAGHPAYPMVPRSSRPEIRAPRVSTGVVVRLAAGASRISRIRISRRPPDWAS
jgi:hypothetical protein